MATEIRMPQLGESVTEGTVVRWLKQPGEHVALDESLAEIETEKVNVEIPSPFEGTLARQLVPEGDTVAVGVPIALIEESGMGAQPAAAAVPSAAGVQRQAAMPSPEPSITAPATEQERQSVVPNGPQPRRPSPSFSAVGPLGPASTAHGMFSTAEPSQAPPAEERSAAPPRDGGRSGATTTAPVLSANGHDMSARYSPAVLRLARDHGIPMDRLQQLQGSGAGGRITRKDVQRYVDAGAAAAPEPVAASAAPVAQPSAPVVRELQEALEPPTTGRPPVLEASAEAPIAEPEQPTAAQPAIQQLGPDEELEPLTPTRRAIAAHMLQSVRTAPHAWMMVEVDVTRLVQHREAIKEEFRRREGVDLTYLAFMVKAVVSALKQHPRMNSSWSDDGVILKQRLNIGIAVDSPQGLVVPVLHDADNYSITGTARQLHDLVERARTRRLRLEDVQGGTFTIDNVGPIGSIVSQPIINQPQCAIVTMESIVKRPVVLDDTIAVRSMMNCCLSFDHRIVDGGDVGPFMKTLKRILEATGAETPIY